MARHDSEYSRRYRRRPLVPPDDVVFADAWQRVAWTMRQEPSRMDDVARARMERNLVEAWRTRSARAVAVPARKPSVSRTIMVVSLAASAVFGAVCALSVPSYRTPVAAMSTPEVPARFDLVIDDGSVQSGNLTEGQTLESGRHGRIEVAFEQSRVDISPETRVRFERLSRSELRLSLLTGRLDVAYHPERVGEQHMSIETCAARVIVVGTRFVVDVDSKGNTLVNVVEGVVQVVPRGKGVTQFVHAGEHIEMPVEAAEERTLRAGIESRLRGDREELATRTSTNTASTTSATSSNVAGPQRPVQLVHMDEHAERSAATEARLSVERQLEAARELLLQGQHSSACDQLSKLAKNVTQPTTARVEALVLIAESLTAQGQIARAAETYREAAKLAPHLTAGHDALFALAMLNERYSDDRSAAGSVYREYLERAPRGALASQARQALCRLGDATSCN